MSGFYNKEVLVASGLNALADLNGNANEAFAVGQATASGHALPSWQLAQTYITPSQVASGYITPTEVASGYLSNTDAASGYIQRVLSDNPSIYAVDTSVTSGAITATYDPPITSLTDGQMLYVKVANDVTSGATFDPGTGNPLLVNNINYATVPSGSVISLMYLGATTSWYLVGSTSPVFANIGGSPSQSFQVAAAVNANESVALGQLIKTYQSKGVVTGTSFSISVSFTAPQNGIVDVEGMAMTGSPSILFSTASSLSATNATLLSSGTNLGSDNQTSRQRNIYSVANGAAVAFTYSGPTSASVTIGYDITAIFHPTA